MVNRLVIAAPQGRTGKTTITLGLLRAFRRRGLKVQPFKKGPDYIDPSWLSAAAGMACRNLDAYFMEPETICKSVFMAKDNCNLAIIEGAMGLYDGLDLAGSSSTAEIAKITRTPVVLVLDASRMTRSAAAIVLGCQHFDPQVNICGVILNKVSRLRHETILREAIETFCHVPVLGAIPKDTGLNIPDRHLGLITQGESNESDRLLDYFADIISMNVDLDSVYQIAASQPGAIIYDANDTLPQITPINERQKTVKIGVLRDKVFSFYYPENINELVRLGAQIIEIDSLTEPSLPADLDALYIGGGFPEVFAADLEKNDAFRIAIKEAVESYLPVYAECGGLMYLGRSMTVNEQTHSMVGALPFDVIMEAKPQGHGYTLLEAAESNLWFDPGTTIKGHEFHNSRLIDLDPAIAFACEVKRGNGIDGFHDGIIYKGVFASYNHLHAYGNPQWAKHFVSNAMNYRSAKHLQEVLG